MMGFFTELDAADKAVGGVGILGAAGYLLQKWMTSWRHDYSARANSDAVSAQFKALQESIETFRKEVTELRAGYAIMDRKIHSQQRTITRMEVLIIKLMALLEENNISVPATLQMEIDALTKDMREPDVRTRASDRMEE